MIKLGSLPVHRIFFILSILICTGSQLAFPSVQNEENQPEILNPDSIVRISYNNNLKIKAARHKLESAEFNFKLFESEYTQFTPFILEPKLNKDSENESSIEIIAGMEKEFFDGSFLALYAGNSLDIVEGETEHTQFIEGALEFPLFSSNRKLSRILKRTFEENEVYSANLSYVNTIRRTIRNALRQYYDFVPRAQILDMFKKYRENLQALLNENVFDKNPDDRRQIDDEIKFLSSEIEEEEVRTNSIRVQLQRWLGLQSLTSYIIEPISPGLGEEDYFGRYYVDQDYEIVLQRALSNDTESKVLQLVVENAKEKKRLAEQGKWDIFLNAKGRYNYPGLNEDEISLNGYAINFGLRIERFDRKVLKYSIQMAVADIANVEAEIEDRKLELAANIKQGKSEVEKQRNQLMTLNESLQSRKEIYQLKLDSYRNANESIDNLIQAFRSLVSTEEDFYRLVNDYYDNIRDLDFLCVVYFEKLGIEIN